MGKKGLSTMSFSKAYQHAAVRCFTCCTKEEWDVNRNLCISLLHTPSMPLNTITGLWTKPLSNASHHAAVRCFTCCAKEEWDVNRNLYISLLHTPSMNTAEHHNGAMNKTPFLRVLPNEWLSSKLCEFSSVTWKCCLHQTCWDPYTSWNLISDNHPRETLLLWLSPPTTHHSEDIRVRRFVSYI